MNLNVLKLLTKQLELNPPEHNGREKNMLKFVNLIFVLGAVKNIRTAFIEGGLR